MFVYVTNIYGNFKYVYVQHLKPCTLKKVLKPTAFVIICIKSMLIMLFACLYILFVSPDNPGGSGQVPHSESVLTVAESGWRMPAARRAQGPRRPPSPSPSPPPRGTARSPRPVAPYLYTPPAKPCTE